MGEGGNDVRTGRWFEPLLRGLPSSARHRLFLPAYEDLRQEYLERRPAGRGPLAWLHRVRFASAVVLLIARCYRNTPGLLTVHPARVAARAIRALFSPSDMMFTHDLRQAFRHFRKQPLFSAAVVAILAVAIGASTAMFSIVEAVLLRPLPFPEAGRLVAVDEIFDGRPASVSPVNFADWAREAKSFQAMGLYIDQSMTLAAGDRADAITGYAVSAGFFRVLGVGPAAGRWFSAEDDLAGARNVVLAYGVWQRVFGGSREVLGRQVSFDGDPYTVIGVAPEGVEWPEGAQAWFSLALTARQTAQTARGAHYASAIARLRRGVPLVDADTELRTLAARLAAAFPRTNAGYSARAETLLDSTVGGTRRALLLVFGAVGCLLLLACVNVSGLLMARAASRRAEMALRTALGAGRLALARQALLESAALAVMAAAAGTLLAAWATSAIVAVVPAELPRVGGVGLNWRVLAFTVAVAATSALLFGFLPALASITPGLAASLKEGRRESVGGGGRRLRGALVAVEVALALVLLIGAGLTVRSFDLLTRVSPGFASRGILTFGVSLPEAVYKEPSQNAAFFERLVSELRSVPGATDSAAVMILPLSASGFGGTFSIDGRPDGSGTSEPRAQLRPVTPGYFRTVGLGVSRGRGFGDPDTADAAPVAVISETTARRFWPGENPVGKRLRMHVSAVRGREPFREIVGVVPDVKTRQVDQPPSPVVYVPHAQHPTGYMNLIVKTAGDPAALSSGALAALQRLDRTLVALQVRPLDDHVAASRGAYRFRAILLGLFAAVAFLLAIVGLYSVVAYVVEQRRHEVGVRLALGATTGQVVGQIAAEGLRPVLVGVLLGGLAALAASKLLAGLLFGVRPYEPAVVAAVAALLLAAAAAACILPARRAAALDPRDVLRSE